MTTQEQQLWKMIRRGILLICGAIEREGQGRPLLTEVRRGLLLIAGAIEQECKATKSA